MVLLFNFLGPETALVLAIISIPVFIILNLRAKLKKITNERDAIKSELMYLKGKFDGMK